MPIAPDQLRRMLEQTLVPPDKVVELDPDTISSTTGRLGSLRGNLAERYQLNSCLTQGRWARLADQESASTIEEFYFTTAADGYDQLLSDQSRWALPFKSAPSWVSETFLPLTSSPAMTSAMYSADLLVAFDSALWKVVPNRPGLQFEGSWSPELMRQATSAVPTLAANEPEPMGLVCIIGNLARASYLSGDRAFRQSAISCGLILGQILAVLATITCEARFTWTSQFIDYLVNDASRCDGVERGVQIMGIVEMSDKDEKEVRQ